MAWFFMIYNSQVPISEKDRKFLIENAQIFLHPLFFLPKAYLF